MTLKPLPTTADKDASCNTNTSENHRKINSRIIASIRVRICPYCRQISTLLLVLVLVVAMTLTPLRFYLSTAPRFSLPQDDTPKSKEITTSSATVMAAAKDEHLDRVGEIHLPPDSKIRVLETSGCSGSTFTISVIRMFLERHGYQVAWGDGELYNPEVYKPHKNRMFAMAQELAPPRSSNMDIIINATVMLHQDEVQKGRISIYKMEKHFIQPLIKRAKGDLLYGIMKRWNILDKVVCKVRDCFGVEGIGYPVFAVNGTKTDLCFKRRTTHEKTKVYILDTRKMIKKIHNLELDINSSTAGFPVRVTYEDLTEFQNTDDENVWKVALDAWTRLMKVYVDSWTSEDDNILHHMMFSMRNTRNISYHEDVIQNYEEVFEALRKAGMGKYIRSRS